MQSIHEQHMTAKVFALFPLLQRILQTCTLLAYFLFAYDDLPFYPILVASFTFSLALFDILLQFFIFLIVKNKPSSY